MSIIPCGEFLPDIPEFITPGSALVQNVTPSTLQSYGPFGSLNAASNALGARNQGALGVRDKNGIAFAFAGTASKLYSLGSMTWADVSGKAYSCADGDYWSMTQFGEQIIANQINDTPQVYTLNGSATFADMAAPSATNGIAPPKAKYSCVAKDFVLYGFTNDATFGQKNQRVWWPAINTATDFYLPGTAEAISRQSDYQDVAGDQGDLTGIISGIGPVDAAVFFERGVYRMMYAGSPNIWDFFPAHGIRGCIAPQTLRGIEIGSGAAIYLASDGFKMYDGQSLTAIGFQKIDKFFFNNVDQTALNHVVASVDPINQLYLVAFPSKTAPSGTCDQMLICNYALPSAIVGTPGRWAYITGINVEFLFRSMSFGYTLDAMDVFGTLDSIGPSLDSRVWTGDKDVLTAFDISHVMNYFTGPSLAPTVETSESQLIPGKRAFVTNSIPLVDGSDPSIEAGTRNRLEDAVVYGSAVNMQDNGYAPIMSYGRYHRFRISLPADSDFRNIQGMEIPDEALTDAGMV